MVQAPSQPPRTIQSSRVHTHCLICEQLCGLEVEVVDGEVASIKPDRLNPHTWRDFCVKAQRSGESLRSPWRIRSPMRRMDERYVEATYEAAIEDIARRMTAIVDRYGPDAVGSYCGNPMNFSFGGIMWHNAFMDALGSHQKFGVQSIDSNARYVACDGVFGLEMLALAPDIDNTDCVILIGTNPAVSKMNWGGKLVNGWRRLKDRVRAGAELFVVDPRRTETATHATLHLAPIPESDWALLLGMAKVILAEDLQRLPADIRIDHLETLRGLTREASPQEISAICGIDYEVIADVARRFARAPRGYAFAGTGPALGLNGVITHWLTHVLNLLTDRIDRPGGRFMPNWSSPATSAADVPAPRASLSRVRGLMSVAGMHSLAELADEILTPGQGQIRCMILAGGNPASAAADGTRLSQALRKVDMLISVDLFQRESHRDADWLIPAVHFLEREEVHVPFHATNDRPFVQTTRQVVPPPTGTLPEWMFYRDLAATMGLTLFDGLIATPDDLSARMLAAAGRVTLEEVRAEQHGLLYGERSMGHLITHLRERGRGADICPPAFAAELRTLLGSRIVRDGIQLISRRRNGMMNGWLAESSGDATRDPVADSIEISPHDASALGIPDGCSVEVRSATGVIPARVVISDDVRAGTAVLAQGFGSPLYDPATGSEVFRAGNERNKLVSDSDLAPLSAVPRLNGTLVTLMPMIPQTKFPPNEL